MYVKMNDGKQVIIIIYVDDLVLTGDHEECIGQTQECLKTEFEMTDLGILHSSLELRFGKARLAPSRHKESMQQRS